jgi:hypothetical protein
MLGPRKRGQYTYEGLNFSLLFEPFYVGKGSHAKCGLDRISAHYGKYRLKPKSMKNNKIKSLYNKGYDIDTLKSFVIKIHTNLTEDESFQNELTLIKIFGRLELGTGSLTNMTNGGEGTSGHNRTNVNKNKSYEEIYGKEKAEQLIKEKTEILKKYRKDKAHSKKWKFISPEGEIFTFEGSFKQFCKEHNITVRCIYPHINNGVIQGKSSAKGWEIIRY